MNNRVAPAIQAALLKDRFPLHKKQQALRRSSPKHRASLQAEFDQLLQASTSLCSLRREKQLALAYPPDLPVSQQRQKIAELIEKHPVVIVAGETGSGKTTQLGKICLELGRGREAMIAHTQPRRIAAQSVATRIAEELQEPLGEAVGYQVRFQSRCNEQTLLKVMTDGTLLAEIAHDRFLEQYDTLIIDEAHERSLNIDFLLGYIKRILPKRPDLKVIITSATIDVQRFSQHFSDAPVVEISGRSYPVEIVYRPPADDEPGLADSVLATVQAIEAEERARPKNGQCGDVLVFLPGEHDIRQCSLHLRRADLPACEILPLYARLPRREQQRIFAPDKRQGTRRIVLATNVAETSLTVPGIVYVIDSGLARISRYSYRGKVQRLPVEKIARASANQRAGRCGRTAPGICYRLYDEADFFSRPEFTEPEIQRTNLSSVILQMQLLRLGDIADFPFMQPPDQRLINDGIKQLTELAALDTHKKLTPAGRQMARLPVDPRLARILVAADSERCLREILVIVSALNIQDPRETPPDKREAAMQKHARFRHAQSDFITLYQLWDYVEQQRQNLGSSAFKRECQRDFLAPQRLHEWRQIHNQLKQVCRQLGLRENADATDDATIHRALLAGFVTQVGFQVEKGVFQGTRNREFRIFPGSGLARKAPKWIMAAELLETSRLYAHNVASIEPQWLYDIAGHLLKFHYHEPFWHAGQGQVLAYQQASLYGLVIGGQKQVSYGRIAPQEAHDIFIRSALVEEKLKSQAAFYQHNRDVKKQILAMEEKSRRRDLLASDDAVFAFYQQRIPEHVHNQAGFDKWRKKTEKSNPRLLFADQSVYLAVEPGDTESQFPSSMQWQGIEYRLQYRFQPGHDQDGVTVQLPVALLNRVPRFLFDWLVPGLRAEKAEALIKTLPKQYRKALVPAPDTVSRILPKLVAQDQAMHVVMTDAIAAEKNISIPLDAWQPEKLDTYYQPCYELLDESGKKVTVSRDLADLISRHASKVQAVLDKQAQATQQNKQSIFYTRWTFADLQQRQEFEQAGTRITAWPALQDHGDKVSIVLTDYPHVQAQKHIQGLVRLAMLEQVQSVKYLRKELLKGNDIQLQMGTVFDKKNLLDDLLFAAFHHTFFAAGPVFARSDFAAAISHNKADLINHAMALEKTVRQIAEADFAVRQQIQKLDEKTFAISLEDVRQQRTALLGEHFLRDTPAEYLGDLPRYLNALLHRVQRLPAQKNKDENFTEELTQLTERWQQQCQEQAQTAMLPAMIEYRWLLEEYRVSLFAQQLKTRRKVSKKRLDNLWQAIQQEIQRNG